MCDMLGIESVLQPKFNFLFPAVDMLSFIYLISSKKGKVISNDGIVNCTHLVNLVSINSSFAYYTVDIFTENMVWMTTLGIESVLQSKFNFLFPAVYMLSFIDLISSKKGKVISNDGIVDGTHLLNLVSTNSPFIYYTVEIFTENMVWMTTLWTLSVMHQHFIEMIATLMNLHLIP